jgi:hypothetical protein
MAPGIPVSDTSSDEQTLTQHRRDCLELLDQCHSCPTILQDIETLDLAQLCDPMHIDRENHWGMHKYDGLNTASYSAVLRWLRVSPIQPLDEVALIFCDLPQRFPDPPRQAIAFWVKQLAVIQACKYREEESESEDSSDEGTDAFTDAGSDDESV